MLQKLDNPDKANHEIDLPFRMVIVGPSGSGKTSLVAELLRRMPNTWSELHIVTKDKQEPIYQYLKEVDTDGRVFFYEGEDTVPLEALGPFDGRHKLVVIDDRVLDDHQKVFSEYFIRCRKLGVSVAYLSQTYYDIPKTIRQNCTHVLLKRLHAQNDLTAMARELGAGLTKAQMLHMMHTATADPNDFFLVDNVDPAKRYRKNFLEIFQVN